MMSTARDPTSRLRAGLNPLLTTSLGMYPNQAATPLSAISLTSHNGFGTAIPTPVSAIQPYNPQEWISSPMPGSERNSQRFSTGEPQASPLPPPPYSPPRSQQRPPSQMYETPPANISAVRSPAPNMPRQSPEQQQASNQAFPPPPCVGRGLSRERRFGIPSLRRRDRDSAEATTPPDIHAPIPAPYPIPSAITSRHHPGPLTLQIPQDTESDPANAHLNHAPGSRRAHSTPAIATPTSARSRSSSQIRWEPGMPVPPPPPGPPPGSRSQSVSRPNSGSGPIVSPPTRRPPPSGVTALGPVPPTPANWTENGPNQGRSRSPPDNRLSQPESSSVAGSSASGLGSSAADSVGSPTGSTTGLARTGAVRGEKTLMQRRTESRTRGIRDSIDASLEANSHQLADIVIPGQNQISRQSEASRRTPLSSRSTHDTTPGYLDDTSRNSTPRALGSAQQHQPQKQPPLPPPGRYPVTDTPPFSPHPQRSYQITDGPSTAPAHIAPKALPTPPPQVRSASTSQTRLTLETITPAPLSPRLVTRETVVKQTADQFCRGTIERFKAFAHKEAAATTDAERVRLFAEFIVSESRVRRERYAVSIGSMGSEVLDLTRDLFRPMPPATSARRESITSQASAAEFTPQSSEPSRSHRGSMGSVNHEPVHIMPGQGQSSSAPASAGLPRSPTQGPSNPNWQQPATANYMPSLSPILSMSISDAYDEEDSRGRPSSRWWEAESNGAPSTRVERSKRESKYMGVGKEAREAMQWTDDPDTVSTNQRDSASEYPPEKTGWHDTSSASDAVLTPQPHLRNSMPSSTTQSGPSSPDPSHLDISRLVTLPPPYPRHHPAVNNNHPELADVRTTVRTLSDMTDVEATKAKFATASQKMRDEAAASSKRRVTSLRANLQQEVAAGNMTYAEAGVIEGDSAEAERAALKDLEKADFERFQQAVVAPVNDTLQGRISRATTLFDELRSRLFEETREPSPNMPQEEGDERPELLEKLTLLKWIFEAREGLHKAVYDLLTDRNDRYRDVVLTPYRLSGNEAKLASARAFFAEDAAKRAAAFAAETLQRTREFRDVVEENVSRGVEVQLSAFWDIAPPLKRLLDEIPPDLRGFRIRVPAKEMLESPSYGSHPLQYLFSLLLHSEKSTYQFIESQTNLLCLLHEVKEAVANARARAVEAEDLATAAAQGEEDAAATSAAEAAAKRMREEEGKRLTADLKEKVRVVQDQWNSALGDYVNGVKERVGEWLLQTGGWDESLEEGAVGEA